MAMWDAMNASILTQEQQWSLGLRLSSCLAEGNTGYFILPGGHQSSGWVLMPSLLLLCLDHRQGGTCGGSLLGFVCPAAARGFVVLTP